MAASKKENGATGTGKDKEKNKTAAAAPKKADKGTASASRGKSTGKGKEEKKSADELYERKLRVAPNPDSVGNRIAPYLFLLCAVLITVFLISGSTSGFLGKWGSNLLFGLFGAGAWGIPVILVLLGVRWRGIVRDDFRLPSFLFALGLTCVVSAVIQTFVNDAPVIREMFTSRAGGGLLGALLCLGLMTCIGKVCTLIVLFVLFAVFLMFTLSVTPKDILIYFRYYAKLGAEKRAARREKREADREAEAVRFEERRREREETRRRVAADARLAAGAPADEEEPEEDDVSGPKPECSGQSSDHVPVVTFGHQSEQEESAPPELSGEDAEEEDGEESASASSSLKPQDGAVRDAAVEPDRSIPEEASEKQANTASDGRVILPDLEDIFGLNEGESPSKLSGLEDVQEQSADITESKQNALTGEKPPEPKPKAEYRPPAITLLSLPQKPKNDNISEEIHEKAKRLVDTLASFRVYVKVTSISVGPSITRYELCPEAGTSVKAIANRADDISLSLASTVRIEAPIPGKSAVGIEVPNKTRVSVYLRELIASKQFTCEENKKRKLLACLGEDVAGMPVFCDLAKMPHLLIAGTTNSGKSVCINSIIISLLYRCSPDDMRMILIDPKHVELKTYNDIPHLLLPVVSEPQKAAGALSWAVNEMERRYRLIEEVGVRNIVGYNTTVSGVEGYEKLPYIVIIIDELADLMLVARDTVENSINRIAAKARAAGMHLVIGTQRPSVDVITGLIKANISSRIAFTVVSQVDSRTIIDVAGAEKLTGMGDMLYSPVGSMKPTRVQGAFVSDDEIERVTSFLRAHSGNAEYSEEIMADIEREAQRFASGKKDSFDDEEDGAEGGEEDPKFRQAVEIAVTQNKIATSMLQRALKIGYGRAARIIDDMERCGYVGPPDGTKPREVLLTMQEYRELVVNDRLGEKRG